LLRLISSGKRVSMELPWEVCCWLIRTANAGFENAESRTVHIVNRGRREGFSIEAGGMVTIKPMDLGHAIIPIRDRRLERHIEKYIDASRETGVSLSIKKVGIVPSSADDLTRRIERLIHQEAAKKSLPF